MCRAGGLGCLKRRRGETHLSHGHAKKNWPQPFTMLSLKPLEKLSNMSSSWRFPETNKELKIILKQVEDEMNKYTSCLKSTSSQIAAQRSWHCHHGHYKLLQAPLYNLGLLDAPACSNVRSVTALGFESNDSTHFWRARTVRAK